MCHPVDLFDAEKARLERILSLSDLEPQRRIAYPLFGVAFVIFILSQAAFFIDPLLCIALLPISFGAMMVGMARLGYYKLFRLLHYQKSVINNLEHNLQSHN